MRDEDRLNRNPMGRDPASLAESHEPRHGFGSPHFRYFAPSPVAARAMEECIAFAHLWRNSFDLSADIRWKRSDAAHKMRQIRARCRELNIKLLREYIPSLRGERKMRVYRTIANLEAQQE